MPIYTRIARIAVGAMLSVAVLATGIAMAANVHLKPPNSEPTFQDFGLFLQASANLAGLGNGDVLILLTATAAVTATCTNPAGATQPPGQNPSPITVAGAIAIPASEIKNGNLSFTVRTEPPPATIAGAPGCPNPNWTETIEDLLFTSATIRVEQPPGTTVLTVSCTFSAPTSNGVVSSANVTCTSI